MIFTLLDPRVWLAIALMCLASFASGYTYHWYQTKIDQAKVESKQQAVTTTTTAAVDTTDKLTVTKLQASLTATKARAATLEQIIKEAKNANPPAISCALPIGLRDQINADLAGRTR